MKTAAKVFLILAIIGAVFYILSGIFCFLVGTMIYANLQAIEPELVDFENSAGIPVGTISSRLLFGLGAFLCVWAVICIIVSSNSLHVLNEADRDNLLRNVRREKEKVSRYVIKSQSKRPLRNIRNG